MPYIPLLVAALVIAVIVTVVISLPVNAWRRERDRNLGLREGIRLLTLEQGGLPQLRVARQGRCWRGTWEWMTGVAEAHPRATGTAAAVSAVVSAGGLVVLWLGSGVVVGERGVPPPVDAPSSSAPAPTVVPPSGGGSAEPATTSTVTATVTSTATRTVTAPPGTPVVQADRPPAVPSRPPASEAPRSEPPSSSSSPAPVDAPCTPPVPCVPLVEAQLNR